MKVELKKNRLIISLRVRRDPTLSRSGKSLLVATTRGVRASTIEIAGKTVLVTANAFIPTKECKRQRPSPGRPRG